jgi:transcriptional regulator with XRE-family HTH domain
MTKDELKRRISSNIKTYRKSKGYTQADLSEKTGIGFQTIASVESCRVWTSDENLCKIAEVLGIDIYKLFLPTKDTLLYEEESSALKEKLMSQIEKIIEHSYEEVLKQKTDKE